MLMWGRGREGQLGTGVLEDNPYPSPVPLLKSRHILQVRPDAARSSCGLLHDVDILCMPGRVCSCQKCRVILTRSYTCLIPCICLLRPSTSFLSADHLHHANLTRLWLTVKAASICEPAKAAATRAHPSNAAHKAIRPMLAPASISLST